VARTSSPTLWIGDRASRSSPSLRIPSSLSRNSEFVGSRSLWAIGFKYLLYNSALVFLFWNCFWADFGRDFCFIDQGFSHSVHLHLAFWPTLLLSLLLLSVVLWRVVGSWSCGKRIEDIVLDSLSWHLCVSFRVFFFALRGWAILCFAREASLENGVWRTVSDSALVKDVCFCSLRLSVMLVLTRRNSKRLVLLLLLPASER